MTADPIESLTALDWTAVQCQCDHPRHHPPCTGQATHAVECHAIDDCDNPDHGPFGNKVQVLCDACLDRLRAHVAAELAGLAKLGGRFACSTCGCPVAVVGDVLRAVTSLA